MSGHGKNESFDDWLARKAAKKDKPKSVLGRSSGLNRGTTPLKRTPLKKVSDKQKKKNAKIQKAYAEHYSKEENRRCDCCGATNGLSVHHIKKRGGDNASDSETFVSLCIIGNYMDLIHPQSNHSHSGGCHGWIEGNKKWARENGYLL